MGNPGRKKGTSNKAPNIKELNKLLNMITEDLTVNYDKLRTSDKIRILQAFSKRYEEVQVISLDGMKFEFGE